MASRSNLLMSALASVVKLHPRLSAGLAFELGEIVGSYVKAARGRRGLAGATAKLIGAAPILQAPPVRRAKKRKVAVKKPKAGRTKVAARAG